jgi:hypothetical protein
LDVLLEFTNTPLNKQLDRPHVAAFFRPGNRVKLSDCPCRERSTASIIVHQVYFSGYAQDGMNDGVLFFRKDAFRFWGDRAKNKFDNRPFLPKSGFAGRL